MEAEEFHVVPNMHIRKEYTITPSYGLIFEINKVKIFITTDTQFCPNEVAEFYNQANIIFHDCETSNFKSSIHAHYDELLTLSLVI